MTPPLLPVSKLPYLEKILEYTKPEREKEVREFVCSLVRVSRDRLPNHLLKACHLVPHPPMPRTKKESKYVRDCIDDALLICGFGTCHIHKLSATDHPFVICNCHEGYGSSGSQIIPVCDIRLDDSTALARKEGSQWGSQFVAAQSLVFSIGLMLTLVALVFALLAVVWFCFFRKQRFMLTQSLVSEIRSMRSAPPSPSNSQGIMSSRSPDAPLREGLPTLQREAEIIIGSDHDCHRRLSPSAGSNTPRMAEVATKLAAGVSRTKSFMWPLKSSTKRRPSKDLEGYLEYGSAEATIDTPLMEEDEMTLTLQNLDDILDIPKKHPESATEYADNRIHQD